MELLNKVKCIKLSNNQMVIPIISDLQINFWLQTMENLIRFSLSFWFWNLDIEGWGKKAGRGIYH